MKKLWKTLFAALLVLPLFSGVFGTATVHAVVPAEDTTSITVNKRVFDGEMPDPVPNTGEEMDFGGEPLEGAGFTVYDVTAAYHNLIKDSDQKTAKETIENDSTTYATTVVKGEKETDGNGQVTFDELPLKKTVDGVEYDAVYLIVETRTPATPTVTQRAQPIVLAMPIYTATVSSDGSITYSDEINTNIQIYPKNVKEENEKVLANASDFTSLTIDGVEYPNITTGDILNYQLTINLPSNLADATTTKFAIKDKPGEGLALADPDELTLAGLVEGEDYTVVREDGGFVANLILNAKVRALAGTKLIVTYKMQLTAEVMPDEIINNNASVITSTKPDTETENEITPPPGVFTGGKKFVKVDAHTEKALAGAKFVVKNEDGKYAELTTNGKGEYVFVAWTEGLADATEMVTPADGKFAVIGLTEGDYALEETEAPNDYVLLTEDILFTVKKGEYTEAKIQTVENTPKGLLPSTGGNGIYAFLVVGAALMIGAYAWFRKSKVQAEV